MEKPPQTTSADAALKALKALEDRFGHWRQNKTYSREAIPLDLLQAAKSLSDHLGHSCVKSRLGITDAQLERADQSELPVESIAALPTSVTPPQFVKTTLNAIATQTWRIELHAPSGAVVTVSGLKYNPMGMIHSLLENVHDCA